MAAKIIKLSDYRNRDFWKEVFTAFSSEKTLHVHANAATGEASVTIVNDDGEAMTFDLGTVDAVTMVEILEKSLNKVGT